MLAPGAIRSPHLAVDRLRVCWWCEVIPAFSNRSAASKKRRCAGDTVSIELHVFLHVEENERAEFFPLASTGGVAAELA
jgi:hypothetical protein